MSQSTTHGNTRNQGCPVTEVSGADVELSTLTVRVGQSGEILLCQEDALPEPRFFILGSIAALVLASDLHEAALNSAHSTIFVAGGAEK